MTAPDETGDIAVVYVDRDSGAAETVADQLASADARLTVTGATSAAEVISLVESGVDCVVSEYELADSNGIELLTRVRTDRPDLPFVLFTGAGSEEVASEAIAAGVTDYVARTDGTTQYASLADRVTEAVERYRSRNAMAERERRLSLFVEQSPLGVIEWDDNFEVRQMNPAAEEILGYAEEELVGRNWRAIVPEEAHEEVAAVVDALLDVEGGYQSVNENVTKEGERIVCEWHNRVVTSANGDAEAVFSQFQDITDRETRSRAITNLHDVATDLTECTTRSAIYERTIEAAGKILDFDRAAIAMAEGDLLRVTAMSEEMPLEEPPTMRIDEGIAGKTYQTRESCLVTDVATSEEAAPQGHGFHAAISVPVGDRGVFQVIDDEPDTFDHHDLELAKLLIQHTEQALNRLDRERELETVYEQVEFVLDVTDTIIWALDLEDGQTTTRIGPARRLFRMDPDDLDPPMAFFEEGVHPEDRDDIADMFGRIRAGTTDEFDVVFRTDPDHGGVRWIHSIGYVKEDAGPRRLVGMARDVTDRERRERELRQQNERLEEFARVISHDLRNPLNVARGRLDLLGETADSDHVDAIAVAHDRMDALIDDLLTLARLGEGGRETEPVDIGRLCRESWQNVTTGAAALEVTVDRTLTADEGRLRQLFENLFANAVEHGGSAVTVRVGELGDGQGFYVEDDGPGIPPADRDEVFEVGYSTAEDGTGFGLRIVEQVAEAHDWGITVTEAPDGGARFEFRNVSYATE